MDKNSVIRTVVLALALINQTLTIFGYAPLPISEGLLEQFIALAFTIGAAIWTWWKNNYISSKGKKQKEVLRDHYLD